MSPPADSPIVTQPGALAPPDSLQIERFRSLIAARLGLRFDNDKLGWLGEVLQRRLTATALDGASYLAHLETPTGATRELAALAQELTVNETYFFRHREQFLALQEHVIPQCLAARPGRRTLRILSAGCASGEEPYSIAMTLHTLLGNPAMELVIHGVDLSPQMVEKARRGRYTAWSLRDTPLWLQQRWFRQLGPEVVLDDTVRTAVEFQQLNLSEDDPTFWQTAFYDVVFCRNVLMYFLPPVARAAMARLTQALVPGGYLFLGHAETMRDLSQEYELCHTHGTFYYQRQPASARKTLTDTAWRQVLPAEVREPYRSEGPSTPNSWFQDISLAAERVRQLTQPSAPPDLEPMSLRGPTLGDDLLAPALDLLQHERFAQALALVEHLPPATARQPQALLLQGVLLAHAGRLNEAEQACHALLAQDAGQAGAHHVLALCREGTGDLDGAAACDRAAIALDPAFAMPRLHLGLLAQRIGDLATVRRELGHALTLLAHEHDTRLLLFGGGFDRAGLLALCRSGLQASPEGSS